MNFFEELEWRGMLHDATPGTQEALENGTVTAYIGFDPTAKSLTIGNYVQIMLLTLFQRSGHNPIVLMGGATGRIGDPSGKDKERQLKSFDELDANLAKQEMQMKKFLDFEGANAAKIVNNHDFYKEMNVLDFLRDVGKTLTVNYMMSKDSVKNRLESGLSFTEFSYQLLQAYDFQVLYEQFGCTMQMGGSDQWGNITSGTEFIRRNTDGKAYAATTPLLTKSDGKKFGKSEEGNIWMDPDMTSPYKFYQFWINADDADVPKFTRYFTLHTKEEIEAREAEYAEDPRTLKKLLAEELTKRVHSIDAYESVQQVSEILFNKKASNEYLKGLSIEALETISTEIASIELSLADLQGGINIVDLLSEKSDILSSKGETKRAIKNNAISVNKIKVSSDDLIVNADHLIKEKYVMIENGKKNKYILIFK
jgi:tyrosyl-tRNA synthetase